MGNVNEGESDSDDEDSEVNFLILNMLLKGEQDKHHTLEAITKPS